MSVSKLLSAASGVGGESLDVDDVYSTFLYTGTGNNQTIQNGIDLTEGGLVWTKGRSAHNHNLHDSATGVTCNLRTNGQNAAFCDSTQISAFTSNGFSVGTDGSSNTNSRNYVSWTFRKANKFFDLKSTSHTNGSTTTLDFSSLGTIGMGIAKRTDSTGDWFVQHRADTSKHVLLNSSASATTAESDFGISGTNFRLDANLPSGTYIVYCFAHHDDDGEFGSSGDQDIINCGSYTGNASTTGPTVDLGFEPQFVMTKRLNATGNWVIQDNMRQGLNLTSTDMLFPNLVNAPTAFASPTVAPNASGFSIVDNGTNYNASGETYIFMAIGRSTKEPTASSQVFSEHFGDGDHTTNFPVDMNINTQNANSSINYIFNRLTHTNILRTNSNDDEDTFGPAGFFANSTGVDTAASWWGSASNLLSLSWKRAQTYFEIVGYTGNDAAGHNVKHGLKVVPEMMWIKRRNGLENWAVFHSGIGETKHLQLNTTSGAITSSTHFNNTAPTNSVFTVGATNDVNSSTAPYIAFLFASVDGVSKVGTVSHTQSSATNVDCGFSNGSKFIILKRTDSTGKWYAFSTGIGGVVDGNDTYLELNTTNAFVTSEDVVDPLSSGFQIASGTASGTYIFYAIAA